MESGMDLSWTWGMGLIGFAFGVACGVGIGSLTLCNSRRSQVLQENYPEEDELMEGVGRIDSSVKRGAQLVELSSRPMTEVWANLMDQMVRQVITGRKNTSVEKMLRPAWVFREAREEKISTFT